MALFSNFQTDSKENIIFNLNNVCVTFIKIPESGKAVFWRFRGKIIILNYLENNTHSVNLRHSSSNSPLKTPTTAQNTMDSHILII